MTTTPPPLAECWSRLLVDGPETWALGRLNGERVTVVLARAVRLGEGRWRWSAAGQAGEVQSLDAAMLAAGLAIDAETNTESAEG